MRAEDAKRLAKLKRKQRKLDREADEIRLREEKRKEAIAKVLWPGEPCASTLAGCHGDRENHSAYHHFIHRAPEEAPPRTEKALRAIEDAIKEGRVAEARRRLHEAYWALPNARADLASVGVRRRA